MAATWVDLGKNRAFPVVLARESPENHLGFSLARLGKMRLYPSL